MIQLKDDTVRDKFMILISLSVLPVFEIGVLQISYHPFVYSLLIRF